MTNTEPENTSAARAAERISEYQRQTGIRAFTSEMRVIIEQETAAERAAWELREAQLTAWQPIETAPKDGRHMVLKMKLSDRLPAKAFGASGCLFVSRWRDGYFQWTAGDPFHDGGIPDEWIDGWLALPSKAALTPPTGDTP